MTLRPLARARTALAALALSAAAAASAIASPACKGTDVLAELAVTDPAAHARVVAAAKATPNTEAVLWRVEKSGLAPSYLFGTAHITDERVTTLTPKVITALDASKRVVLEVADLSPGAMADAMGTSASLLMNTAGSGLQKSLSPEEFERVKATLTKAGIPAQLAMLARPWLIHMLLSMPDCERNRVGAGLPVLDMRIADEGKKRGLPLLGLETLESQFKAMASIPEPQQLDMLRVSLKYADRTQDLMESMILMYTRRQMGAAWPLNIAMAEKAGVAASQFSGFESEILLKRNEKMRDRAIPLLELGSTFVGVGALHLIGDKGLVALLRQKGYTVTAIE